LDFMTNRKKAIKILPTFPEKRYNIIVVNST